jgi:hypothetical protein
MPTVDPATEPIRRAFASGEFRKAQALWEEHARLLRAEIRSRTFTAAKLAHTRELVEWCVSVARCAKSHAQARFNRIAVARRYANAIGHPTPRVSTRA